VNSLAVFDVESDGLLDEATKIHCLVYTTDGKNFVKLHDYDAMKDFLQDTKVLIGHYIRGYDIWLLEKLLNIKIKSKIYDTLPMSWVMFPDRSHHGLESFGEDYGIPKPKIDDWKNLTVEEYTHRCTEDVKINWALWTDLIKRFKLIYGKDREGLDRYLQYLTFKIYVASLAENTRWKLDVDLVKDSLAKLEKLQVEKTEELANAMPLHKIKKKKQKPKVMYKKDGSLSSHGESWISLLDEQMLPHDYDGVVEVISGVERANPNSTDQVKDWLFSLGWQPCTFDYKKNDDGSDRLVPQVRDEGELTASVKLLIDKDPAVGVLDGLTVIQHRMSIFKGMLEFMKDGYVKAGISGLTNTLRFKHRKPLVNLPGVDKPWGKEIRGALIASPGEVLCGADMVSLEANTKKHFIFPYDPDYVREMSVPGFDEHLDLAVRAGYLERDDYDFYTRADEDTVNDVGRYKSIKKVRKKFKPVNYSAIYGVGKAKLSRTTGMAEAEAQTMLDAYWSRNWAVKKLVEDLEIKTVNGQMWLKNPVNGFWYSLRYKKDAFSTLNQGTGAYCFDQWTAHYLSKRPNIVGQFHDESINGVKEGEQEEHTAVLKWAIAAVNKKLKLNIDLDVDVQYGTRYSEIH
jgi:hypothetical protein